MIWFLCGLSLLTLMTCPIDRYGISVADLVRITLILSPLIWIAIWK